jgi:hypothetical protein
VTLTLTPEVGGVVELRARINNTAAFVTSQALENTWHETERRLDVLRATDDTHTEKY